MSILSRAPIYGKTTQFKGSKKSSVRRSFGTDKLDPLRYEIRVRRTYAESKEDNVLDDVYLGDVNEIITDPMGYSNTAVVGVKIRLTDQISGIPKVTYLNGGKIVRVYGRASVNAVVDSWQESATTNPAWIVWDMLTNARYGGGMPEARLDLVAFKDWATYCEQQNLTWNGVLEAESNVWDAAQLVLRVGHAQLINVGTRYSVVIERASDPVMMFSVANMVEGSYKETWLGTADRANEIDVTFYDKTDDYKARTVKVYDPAVIASGAKQRPSAITLQGVVDYETAYKEAQFQLNLNRYILKTVSFSAPIEAIACSVGDLIYVQHDMTEWAVAGRFDAGSTTSVLKLDRDVTMEVGKQYKLLVTHDSVQRYSGTVTNVVGNSLFLTGYPGTLPVKRIHINGQDIQVSGKFNQTSGYGVIIDDSVDVTAGSTYTLWDTDVIEEYDVVNNPGAHSIVTLQNPTVFTVLQYGNWMFGETAKVKNKFRVKSVTGSHEYTRDIVAIQYDPDVYDHSRYGTNVGVLPPKNDPITSVRNLELYEETYVTGISVVTKVVASWQDSQWGTYSGADVYVKRGTGAFEKQAPAINATSAIITASKGEVLTVKVVAYNIFGKRSSYDLAPEATYTVLGELPKLDVGDVTGANYVWAGRDCKLNWRYNATTHSYDFGSEPSAVADAGSLDPHFKDYEIKVYDSTHKILRRTEHVVDDSYTYTYDKNFTDGITRHLIFEIRMRDVFSNVGDATVLVAQNAPPTILGTTAKTDFESVTFGYTHSDDADFVGCAIWMSTDPAALSVLKESDVVFKGPDKSILVPGLMFNTTYYYRMAAYDAFGMTELIPTATLTFKTTYLDANAIAAGTLDGSKLIPFLKERIDLIDGDYTVPGSVAARIHELETDTKTLLGQVDTTISGKVTALGVAVDNLMVSATVNVDGKLAVMDKTFTDMINGVGLSANAKISTINSTITDPATGLIASANKITAINDVSATSTSYAAKTLYSMSNDIYNSTTGLKASSTAIGEINNVSQTSTSYIAQQMYKANQAIYNSVTGLLASSNAIAQINNVSLTSTSYIAQQLATQITKINDPKTGLLASSNAIASINDVSLTSDSYAARQLSSQITKINDPVTGLLASSNAITALNDISLTSSSYGARQLASQIVKINDAKTGLAASSLRIDALNDVSLTSSSYAAQQLASQIVKINDPKTGLIASSLAIDALNNVSLTSTSYGARQLATTQAEIHDSVTGLKASSLAITALNDVSLTSTSYAAKTLASTLVKINDSVTGLNASSLAITALNDVSLTSKSYAAAQLAQTISKISDPVSGLVASNLAITALNNISQTSTSITARKVSSLDAAIYDATTGLAASAVGITNLNDVSLTSKSANAVKLATTIAQVNNPITGLPQAVASIQAINNVATTSTSAIASQFATLKAAVNDPTTGLASYNARINEINNVSATTTSAAAQKMYQLNSRMDNVSPGVSLEVSMGTMATALTGLQGQYAIKLDNAGHISGFGLSTYSAQGVPTSQFAVNADTFAITSPSYPSVFPFTVGAVNGVLRTIITSAIIGDASINTAKIGDLQVNTLKIQNNAVTIPMYGQSVVRTAQPAGAQTWAYAYTPSSYMDTGFITAIVQVIAENLGDPTNCQCKLYLRNTTGTYVVPFSDDSVTLMGRATQSVFFMGTIAIPIVGGTLSAAQQNFRVECLIGNSWNSGTWTPYSAKIIAFGSKK